MSIATRFRLGKPLHDRGVLIGNVLLSTLVGFRGFVLDGEGIGHIATAATAAAMSGFFMYLYWRWFLDRIAHSVTNWGRALAVSTLLVVGPAIFFGSTTFGASALRGPAALEVHMHRSVEVASAAVAVADRQFGLFDTLVADIRIEADYYRRAAREERSSGAYTGTAGNGAVAQALDAIAERLETLAAAIERARQNRDGLTGDAEALLASMRETIGSDGTIPERMRTLKQQYDRLRRILADIASGDIAGTINRTLERLPVIAETHVPLSANLAVAAEQRRALARIHQDLTTTSEGLGTDLASLHDGAETALPGVEVITAYNAVYGTTGSSWRSGWLLRPWISSGRWPWLSFYCCRCRRSPGSNWLQTGHSTWKSWT